MTKKPGKWRALTPLGIIAAFISLTEGVAGVAVWKTTGYVQVALTTFVCVFPLVVFVGFFLILWAKSHVFYPPAEFGSKQDVKEYVDAMRGQSSAPSLDQQGKAEPQPVEPAVETASEKSTEILPDEKPASKKVPSTPAELQAAMFFAFFDKNIDEGEKMFATLMAAETDPIKRKGHKVWHAYLRYAYGRQADGWGELLELTKDDSTRSDASFYLGSLYEQLKEFDKAIDCYETAVETAAPDVKSGRIVSLAEAHFAAGHSNVATAIVFDALEQSNEDKDRSILYRALARILSGKEDEEWRALALELALHYDPHDNDLRFKTAFAYSKHGHRDLALFHYTALLAADPANVMALNNIGVEYQNAGMPISAVRNYRRAFDRKETLAGSNLAYLFMNAGFWEEAHNVLNKAKTEDNPHPNVGSAMAALAQKEESETEGAKQILDRAIAEQRFMKEFGQSRFSMATGSFDGTWKIGTGETFEITCVDTRIKATWKVGTNKHELSGITMNRTAKITYTVTPDGFVVTGYRHLIGYGYLSAAGEHLHCLFFDNRVPEFLDFIRVTDA